MTISFCLEVLSLMKRMLLIFLCICLCSCFFCAAFSASAVSPEDTRSPLPLSYGKAYTVKLSGCSPTPGRADSGRQLTDRAFASSKLTTDDAVNWIGYTSNGGSFTVEVTLDLGDVYDMLRHFTVSVLQRTSDGVYFPRAVHYAISTDGSRYTSLGDGICDCDVEEDPYYGLFNLTLEKDVTARYVRATIEGGAGQSVYMCEMIAEGRTQLLTRIGEQAKEGGQYTDAQGVVYTLRNGKAVVTDYRDMPVGIPTATVFPSDADFNREGDYLLGAGTVNPVTVHAEFIPHENFNFSNLSNDVRAIVIHNTDTVEDSTTAELYQSVLMSGKRDSSWQYTVDDGSVIYHNVPDEYAAWHAGSDESYASIGIEMCVNGAPTRGGDDFIYTGASYDRWVEERFRKTIENTAVLVAELLVRYNLPESAVLQHYDCSEKNCPRWLRYTASDGKFRHEGDLWLVLKERIHAYYTLLSEGAQAFTPASDVVLPEYLVLQGGLSYPVAEVASGAFAGKSPVLRSIALSDTVRKVSADAFTASLGLEAVTVSPTHPTLMLRGAELYDANGTLLFTPSREETPVPSPQEDGGLWVEEHDGEYWLLGLYTPCSVEALRQMYGAEELHVYANAIGTGTFVLADGAPMRIVLQGDADGDGKIGATDYMIAKRTVLGTFIPAPIRARAIMINDGKTIGTIDYIFLKRCVLGTLRMPAPVRTN